MASEPQRSLETAGVRKEYPGIVALEEVSVRFEGGKVSALLGKNGAGKSTLVKILSGAIQPTRGEVRINGQPVRLTSTTDAFRAGIATVYQELSLVPELTVAENILLGRMPRKAGVMIDWAAGRARAAEVLAAMGVEMDVRLKVSSLGIAQQQVIEIAKAMSFEPSVLMLDEPTSALARHETEMLFRIVRRLADKGVAIVYITHRLQELVHIADSVTVLRDGKHVGTVPFAQTTPDSIVHMMFGEVVQRPRPADLQVSNEPLLEVRGLARRGRFQGVNLTLHRGEILGIAGMLGSGRTELLRAIFGADRADGGSVLLDGQAVTRRSPRLMKKLGLGMVSENRKEESLVLPLSIRKNICLASLNRVGWCGMISGRQEQQAAKPLIERLQIKAADAGMAVESLSGGNQQKVVVGKWLNTLPRVMLFDEPTRGIDVQAKQQIFDIIWKLSREGIGSIFVSSELEELLEVCHRIVIMKAGEITEEVRPEAIGIDELVVRCMEERVVPRGSAA